jgi:plasmid stability protein
MIAMQQKMQADQQMAGLRMEEKQQDMELKQRDAVLQLQMKAAEHAQDMEVEQRKAVMGAASEIQKQRIFQAQAAAQGAQKLSQSEQQHQQKLTQAKELKSSQASANKNSGTGKASSKPKNSSKP